MIPFTDTIEETKPAAEPTIWDIAKQKTERKEPSDNADAWQLLEPKKKVEAPPVTDNAGRSAETSPGTEPEVKYTKEDYEFSARNTTRFIEQGFKLVGNGTNYGLMRYRIRKLFKGKSSKQIKEYLKELEAKMEKNELTKEEQALWDNQEAIYAKYDLMEQGIPFSDEEKKDLQDALMDYQEYKKKIVNPKLMIYFTIASILLKRVNIYIFN